MWQAILAGLSLGLISSLHCVGMCGPLMLALPVRHLPVFKQVAAIFLYNAGRITTYSAIGLLLGLAGRRIYLAGFQQWFSISLGCVIMLLSILYFYFKRSWQPAWIMNIHLRVQTAMSYFLQKQNFPAFLFLGMLNGLLPCGMVYLAIAGALVATHAGHSVLFMTSFGAGTLPAMMIFGLFSMRVSVSARRQVKKAMPYFMAGMAMLLILRGMNLGIPFISPALAQAPGQAVICHP